jgi:hypothetical protein
MSPDPVGAFPDVSRPCRAVVTTKAVAHGACLPTEWQPVDRVLTFEGAYDVWPALRDLEDEAIPWLKTTR